MRVPAEPLELCGRKDEHGVSASLLVPDTTESERLAAEVGDVNAWLASADIKRADCASLWLHEPERGLPTVTSTRAVSLRRVFNNGNLAQGGRLYGGWWQTMSQRERAGKIQISGERIAELDFTAMVPRICYALRGVPWPFGNDRDAPYLAGPQATRAAWKQWTNTMLFSRRVPHAWPGQTVAARLEFSSQFAGIGAAQARDLVLQRHAALAAAGGFGCELGMEAMRAESDIAVDVVLRLRNLGVPCLPIHDGFAVPASKADAAQNAMMDAAAARIGTRLAVAIK